MSYPPLSNTVRKQTLAFHCRPQIWDLLCLPEVPLEVVAGILTLEWRVGAAEAHVFMCLKLQLQRTSRVQSNMRLIASLISVLSAFLTEDCFNGLFLCLQGPRTTCRQKDATFFKRN